METSATATMEVAGQLALLTLTHQWAVILAVFFIVVLALFRVIYGRPRSAVMTED